MQKTTEVLEHVERLTKRFPQLAQCREQILASYELLRACYDAGGMLLVCGNGGSGADAEHIVGELMKGFYRQRSLSREEKEIFGELGDNLQEALPAISLTGHPALSTAFMNDVDPEMVFAQQVYGYGRKGDVLMALTTSGNSRNVLNAARVARAKGMKVVGLTGRDGGSLKELCDVCIIVPGQATADIQEYHLPVYHTICAMLEESFFEEV